MVDANTYKKLSIVIPAHNEERTIGQLLKKVFDVNWGMQLEVIVINDGSTDRTVEIVQGLKLDNLWLLNNEQNLGKSQSVKKGLLETKGDLVVIQDADLEYDPAELLLFIDLFRTSDVDVVYGNRFGKHNKVIYWQNWFGNRFLSLVSSLFTYPKSRMWTNDMEVCYKMAKGDIFRAVAAKITSTSRFGLEPELTSYFAKYRKSDGTHLKFREVPISYYARTIAEGKQMNAVKDGIKALVEIVKFGL